MPDEPLDPIALLRPRRPIQGISAVVLPMDGRGGVDWPAFRAHLRRTLDAGLTPAVNMDTGYVHLLDAATRRTVLRQTREIASGAPFVAGAFVGDHPGMPLNAEAYLQGLREINEHGGTPVIFQSFGLTECSDEGVVEAYQRLAVDSDRFIGFELGAMFAPFGRIYSLEVYARIMNIPACIGAKHSSLRRDLEWRRLRLRDQLRPDFRVYTGNDLAIDMVMYGSDYLLGLSTFAPDLFALRDAWWREGRADFYQLNDVLQFLGFFAFREPVPAYKHAAAMFLKLRGWLDCDQPHPRSPRRPDADREVLALIARRLEAYVSKPQNR